MQSVHVVRPPGHISTMHGRHATAMGNRPDDDPVLGPEHVLYLVADVEHPGDEAEDRGVAAWTRG